MGFLSRIGIAVCVWTHLSPLRQQFRDTDEVVTDQIEQEVGGDSGEPPVLRLAHGAVLLPPTKNAFDHLAAGLRPGVAGVPCGSPVNGASPVRVVLCNMWRDVLRVQAVDVFLDVIGLIPACRNAMRRRRFLDQHVYGRLPLRRAGGLRHDPRDGEAVSVLHHGVP